MKSRETGKWAFVWRVQWYNAGASAGNDGLNCIFWYSPAQINKAKVYTLTFTLIFLSFFKLCMSSVYFELTDVSNYHGHRCHTGLLQHRHHHAIFSQFRKYLHTCNLFDNTQKNLPLFKNDSLFFLKGQGALDKEFHHWKHPLKKCYNNITINKDLKEKNFLFGYIIFTLW